VNEGGPSEPVSATPGGLADPLPLACAIGLPPRSLVIRLPGSKSLTNRAVLLAALAHGTSEVRAPLDGAEDSEVMLAAVQTLGATVERRPGSLRISGVGGRWRVPPGGAVVDCRNAGTAARFVAGAALLADGPVTIDGSPRMRQRPIGELTTALAALGASVEFLGQPACPPVRITPPPPGTSRPESLTLATTQSSQFISALLLAAPWLGGLTLRLTGEVTSAAYVTMTLGLLARLGATVRTSDDTRVIRVYAEGNALAPFSYEVEPDASGATYWWGAGALLPGWSIGVPGLDESSLQGDARFPEVLARMGCRVERADGVVRVLGSERLEPVLADLSKLGVRVETAVHGDSDALTITPPPTMDGSRVEFDTYDDHRMAMSLALVALRRPGVWVRNPGCVAKTYPGFWNEFARLTTGPRGGAT
jgi:3-phosphoshikimate 1-carboxyvinyltransferase